MTLSSLKFLLALLLISWSGDFTNHLLVAGVSIWGRGIIPPSLSTKISIARSNDKKVSVRDEDESPFNQKMTNRVATSLQSGGKSCEDDDNKESENDSNNADTDAGDAALSMTGNKLEEHNKAALEILLQILHSKKGWKFVNEKDGVKVEKMFLPLRGNFISKNDASKGSKHACVKSSGVINSNPESVLKLFMDNSRVKEYNEHCEDIRDVEYMHEKSSKITWASGPKYGPFKARDFVSVVHYVHYPNGTSIILNRPAYHSKYPSSDKYVRATILLAGNVIEPYGNGQTLLTQVAHINPGGGADTAAVAWIINKLCALGPPTFIRNLEKAAQKYGGGSGGRGGGSRFVQFKPMHWPLLPNINLNMRTSRLSVADVEAERTKPNPNLRAEDQGKTQNVKEQL